MKKNNVINFILIVATFISCIIPKTIIKAETMAQIKIYVIIQKGLFDDDVEVDLINTSDESEKYTFTVKKTDDWAINAQVPEGEYKIEARIKGYDKYANIRAAYSDFPKTIKADGNPPIITVLEGYYEFAEKAQWLCDYGDFTGDYIKGEVAEEDLKKYEEKSVACQDLGTENDDKAITDKDKKEADKKSGEEIDSGFKEEDVSKEDDTKKPNKIEPIEEEENKSHTPIYIACGIGIILIVAFIIIKKKIR